MSVVHDAQHQALLRGRRQERQRGDSHQEWLDRGAVLLPECHSEGTCLRRRQVRTQSGQRPEEAVQRGEREGRLGLEALRPQDHRIVCLGHHRLEQRGLADPRLASYDDAAGRAVASPIDERREVRPLGVPTDQHLLNVHARRRPVWTETGTLTGATLSAPAARWSTLNPQSRGTRRAPPGGTT